MGRFGLTLFSLCVSMAFSMPVYAEIVGSSEHGFNVRDTADVTANAEDTWKTLIEPARWWSGERSFSGDAANLSIDPHPGGCFCEVLPGTDHEAGARGGVEHMRVVLVDRAKALRMIGGLGPLQSEAVQAVLTITIKPIDGGTRITWDYVVEGYMRYKQEQIAPAVDKVIAEQASRLADKLGVKVPATDPVAKPGMESGR